jgi:acyl-CoA synthetase (AMP-forming)/AMP-acid ligase II
MKTLADIEAELLGPGGAFEILEVDVLGHPTRVFKNRPASLRHMLADAAIHGDNDYIVCEDLRLSFVETIRRVASTARVLEQDFGVGAGDRVAILAANGPEWIIAFWATVSLGAIAVGMNGWWVHDEILYALGDCAPKVLIADSKRLDRVRNDELGVPIVEIEKDFEAIWTSHTDIPLPERPIAEDDPATILYTSGTTGRPKGAVSTHRNIVGLTQVQICHGIRAFMYNAEHGDEHNSFESTNCALNSTPLFHVSGLFAGVVTLLAAGCTTMWTRGRFDPVQVMQLIERERITNWAPMGTMLHRVIEHPERSKYDLSSIRNTGSGGAPISPELQTRMREAFPNARKQIGIGYGLTEGTALATLNFGEDLIAYPDSVGRPLPTMEMQIRGDDDKPLPEGAEGEIHLRGPLVMKEYWGRPVETAEAIKEGRWLRTGDVGRVENGRLYIASRKRDMILRGGENIYPIEIEQQLDRHPAVLESAVIGRDHLELGQEVEAVVVLRRSGSVDAEELRDWVAKHLAYYKVPVHWQLRVEPLPRNASGKVMKHLLAGQADNPFVEE